MLSWSSVDFTSVPDERVYTSFLFSQTGESCTLPFIIPRIITEDCPSGNRAAPTIADTSPLLRSSPFSHSFGDFSALSNSPQPSSDLLLAGEFASAVTPAASTPSLSPTLGEAAPCRGSYNYDAWTESLSRCGSRGKSYPFFSSRSISSERDSLSSDSHKSTMAAGAADAHYHHTHAVHGTSAKSSQAPSVQHPDSSEEDHQAYEAVETRNSPSHTTREIGSYGGQDHGLRTPSTTPGTSPPRRTGPSHLFDAFRPRSKSDSKGHHRNIMSAIKNTVNSHHWFSTNGGAHSPGSPAALTPPALGSPTCGSPQGGHSPYATYTAGMTSAHSPLAHDGHYHTIAGATSPDGFDYRPQSRPRSGSESKGVGAVAKVMDMFRTRSQSMSLTPEAKAKKFAHSHSGSLIRRHSVDPDRRRSGGVHGGTEGHHVLHTALIHRIHSHNSEQSGGGHYASLPGSTCHQLQHPAGATAQALGLASSESSICDRIDIEDLGADETMLFVKFFRYYHCYDLIPLSAKLVVFDTQLLVKKAFFALVSNGVRAAPLWDSAQQDFVGMLTITDFIHILRKYHGSPTVRMDELEEHKIDTWRTVLTEMQRPLVSIGPDASLCDAITALIQQRVHRLPVIDPQTGNVLYVLTHKRILRFLFLYFYDLPHASYLDQSIQELKVGSFENIATCNPTTPLIDALKTFIERRVSALPVVDEDGKVVDIYAKFDVINLAAEKTYNNLDISVGATLEFRNQYFEGVMTCRATDSLLQVMGKIVRAEVHRLVIVDDEEHVVGIVSLSDILTFLVLKPLDIERPASRSYGIYARTTSSERENGTLAEEPELEATANAHGEGAVQTERLKHSNGSMCTVTDPDQAKEGQNAPKATEESMENEEKISVAQEGSIIESQQPEGPNSPQECFEHPAEQDDRLSNMSAEKLDDSEKASEKEELPQKLLSAKSALAPVAGVSTATSTQPENRADIITPVDTKS
ncbi:uncharacterized protein LOC111243559 isoform X3 [Varroa destructor]|uniref:CBS domain-containing protein n=2 Tax=Varroa destructor TaxID=109461 RepID=A0A7M7J6I9_VARDE|nr:uncharacterized protein LOC111243559 isoform X3 [Varroa destructor]XP_022645074.1 uncharacterized protein LOC111243559 isoform X3 [Varroa destructor]